MKEQDRETNVDNSVAGRLRERIRREGAITFRDWMQSALYDPQGGYYQRADLTRWGRAGDYRTSPERSPLFAATFARYFAALYKELGAPELLTIIEAGAGAGYFAQGILSTLQRDWPQVYSALQYVVDEESEAARTAAESLLAPWMEKVEFRPLTDISAPLDSALIFSNELLDAFAVHRVRLRRGRLFELYVELNKAGAFIWVERELSTPRLAAHFERTGSALVEGQSAEVNLAAEEWIERAASLLRRGVLLTVDYGAEAESLYSAPHRRDGTLRGISRHALIDNVLENPGQQDLTTTVNWTQIRLAGERAGLQTVSFERQDAFLLRNGLLEQLERETQLTRSEADALRLRLGAREMILPGGMSESFQVLVQKKGN